MGDLHRHGDVARVARHGPPRGAGRAQVQDSAAPSALKFTEVALQSSAQLTACRQECRQNNRKTTTAPGSCPLERAGREHQTVARRCRLGSVFVSCSTGGCCLTGGETRQAPPRAHHAPKNPCDKPMNPLDCTSGCCRRGGKVSQTQWRCLGNHIALVDVGTSNRTGGCCRRGGKTASPTAHTRRRCPASSAAAARCSWQRGNAKRGRSGASKWSVHRPLCPLLACDSGLAAGLRSESAVASRSKAAHSAW